MISVTRSEVPFYLQEGEFYRSLVDDADTSMLVPDNVLKSDQQVENDQDLVHLLSSLRFWVIEDLPDQVFVYFLAGDAHLLSHNLLTICEEFKVQFPILLKLHTIMSADASLQIKTSIEINVFQVLKYLHQTMGRSLDANLCYVASLVGACDCLKYVHQNGCEPDAYCCEVAASNGFLDCLAYLHSVNTPWDSRVCRASASNGHLACLQFATEHGCTKDPSCAICAAFGGHLDCLQYAIAQGENLNRFVASAAAGQGHCHILRYLHSIQCEWDASVTARAAETGHLDCLRFLHKHGCPWDFNTCHNAAYHGHLECLQYAHGAGCALNSGTTMCAVGHVPCLQYLHAQGCPWHEGVCLAAVHKNHPESALFAVLHDAPHTFEFYAYVEDAKWEVVLDALHSLGYPDKYDEEEDSNCNRDNNGSSVFTF